MTRYRYKLLSTGNSSQKYGNCEVCNKSATEVFHLVEERQYALGWTQQHCQSIFGHKECLEAKRK